LLPTTILHLTGSCPKNAIVSDFSGYVTIPKSLLCFVVWILLSVISALMTWSSAKIIIIVSSSSSSSSGGGSSSSCCIISSSTSSSSNEGWPESDFINHVTHHRISNCALVTVTIDALMLSWGEIFCLLLIEVRLLCYQPSCHNTLHIAMIFTSVANQVSFSAGNRWQSLGDEFSWYNHSKFVLFGCEIICYVYLFSDRSSLSSFYYYYHYIIIIFLRVIFRVVTPSLAAFPCQRAKKNRH
jgi:hypothetical protein